MKKIFNSELFTTLFPIVILPIATTIISLVINKANSNMSIASIIISTLSIFIVIIIVCFSSHFFLKKISSEIVKNSTKAIALEAIKMYEEKQKISKSISEELFSLRDILEIEEKNTFQDKQLFRVDIIANSFNYDETDQYGMKNCFRDVVIKNVKNNIQYNFYITDIPESLVYINDLNNKCKNKLNCFVIDNHFFLLMKDFDFTIYYFKDDNGFTERIGFMPLNNLLHNKETKDLYHIRMPDTQVKSIVSILPDCIIKDLNIVN